MGAERYRCVLCRSAEYPLGMEFESHTGQCPRCTARDDRAVVRIFNIHLYFPDPINGPIVGDYGRRYRVACSPNSLNPNGLPCTGDPSVVTCPRCKATADWRKSKDLFGVVRGGFEILKD